MCNFWASALAFASLLAASAAADAGGNQTAASAEAAGGSDLDPAGACRPALERYCGHALAGAGRKAQCLRSQMAAASFRNEAPLPKACMLELRGFFQKAAQAGAEPVPGFWSACEEDLQKRCPGKPNGLLAQCLKEVSRESLIQAARRAPSASLTQACSEKLMQVKMQEAADLHLDLELLAACEGDLQRLRACRALPRPAWPGAKKACLQGHRRELTGNCSAALFRREQDDAEDVRLDQALFRTCKAEISGFCGEVQYGEARILKCLWERQSSQFFGTECKERVTELTRHKASDYRLDYRLRTRCARDIQLVCEQEQQLVDGLTATELFGAGWRENRSGLVLQCLKQRYGKLSRAECKREVESLIRVHAVDPSSDPVLRRSCSSDIRLFCNRSAPELVHLCLRNNLEDLQPECKKLEVLHGRLASGDIRMKPLMQSMCKQETAKFCADVEHGEGLVIQCLQDSMLEEGYSARCRAIVQQDLEASNHDWRLKFGIHHYCSADAGALCSADLAGNSGQVLLCLKRLRNQVTGDACKVELDRFLRFGAENIRAAPDTYAACVQDVQQLCPDVLPGQGRVHSCLVDHKKELSVQCAKAEFLEEVIKAEDIRRHPQASIACRSSWRKLCPDVPFGEGRMWRCLEDGKDKLTSPCKAIIRSHERLENFEFRLNPRLAKDCRGEATRLCPFEATMAGFEDFSSEGKVISCLIRERKNVTDEDCKGDLLRKEVQRLADISSDPTAVSDCQEDTSKFCGSVSKKGHGELHKCLQEHLKDISAPCRMVEVDYMRMVQEDFRLWSTELHRDCDADAQRFCKAVPVGTGQTVLCMLMHMHDKDMTSACSKKLAVLQDTRAKSLTFNPLAAQACKATVGELYAQTKDVVCQPHDAVAGLAGLSGTHLTCLTRYYEKVPEPECKSAVHKLLFMQNNDIRANFGMSNACRMDMSTFCSEVPWGGGQKQACLRKNIGKLAAECKKFVSGAWRTQSHDAMLSPGVRGRCQSEMQAFCSGVEHGDSRVLLCLKQNENATGFGGTCREELGKLQINATTAEQVAREKILAAMSQLSAHRALWDQYGMALLGALAFLVLATLGLLLALALRLARGRPAYGIEVAQAEAATATPEATDKV